MDVAVQLTARCLRAHAEAELGIDPNNGQPLARCVASMAAFTVSALLPVAAILFSTSIAFYVTLVAVAGHWGHWS